MSLFQFKISSLSKQKNRATDSLFRKPSPSTTSNSFRVFSEKSEEFQDEASQFFIDDSELWNDEDKDVFMSDKDYRKQSNKPILNISKESDIYKETISELNDKHEELCEDKIYCEEDIRHKDKIEVSDFDIDLDIKQVEEAKLHDHSTEEEKQNQTNLDVADHSCKNPSNAFCFDLVEESDDDNDDDDVILPKSPEKKIESPKSPTFPVYKFKKKSSCTSDSKKDDSDSDSISNSVVKKSSSVQSINDKTNLFTFCKEKINPLGLAEETDIWLNDISQSEALSNVTLETPVEKLQNNLTFLNKFYIEILEKVMTAFENLPIELLSQFSEFDPNVFMTLRTTKRRIKAVMIKTENLLKRKNSSATLIDCKNLEEKKNFDCSEFESLPVRDFSRLKYSSDSVNSYDEMSVNKPLEGVFSFKKPVKSRNLFTETKQSTFSASQMSKSNLMFEDKQTKLNFPVLGSSKPSTFSKPDAEMVFTASDASLINYETKQNSSVYHLEQPTRPNPDITDYTDFVYRTSFKDCPDKNMFPSESFHTNIRSGDSSGEFDGLNFPHSKELLEKFRQKFGLKTFRPNQLQVINAALLGYDCFVLMPTGGGKSLCYQLPALVSKGVTVVISPLRSLIQDQVTKLLTLDIAAAHLSGDNNESNASLVYRKLNQPEPKIKLLYVTPEKVGVSTNLRNCLLGLYKRNMLARFVIDEAHCVSQWGHDFRPDYKKLRELRENYPDVNIMALTATATPRVRTDILHQLKVANPKWFLSSFNRSNLMYSVKEKKGKSTLKEIAALIQSEFKKDTGVIYCFSRKECEDVAKDLKEYGITAIPYHAGLDDNERTRAQNLWMNDKVKVVCATIAFGMGIDKLDVRFVIHFSLPKSIEGYYQESGRAGRDGEKATCILFYSYRDKIRMLKLINMDQSMHNQAARKVHVDNLFRVVAFAENKTDCRRALQLEYFGEKFDRKKCIENRNTACDNCLSQGLYEIIDVTAESKAIVSSVREVCGTDDKRNSNFTMLHFVDVFKGTLLKKVLSEGHDSLPLYGMGKSWQRLDVERLFRKLIMEEFLKERLMVKDDGITFAYIKFGRRGEELLKGNIRIMFEIKKRKGSTAQANSAAAEKRVHPAVLEIQEKCYSDLMDAIHEIASSVNCNPNAIMNVQALRAMSCNLPESPEEMLSINHVTTANFEKYGSILLEITKKFASQKKALQLKESPEKDVFMEEVRSSKLSDDSPYFETEITYAGKGKGGRKRQRSYHSRRYQNSKKWKGSSNSNKATASKSGGAKGNAKNSGNGSGVMTVPGSKVSKLMELPTNKSRGFDRPKVILKNI